jgi:formate hydrogenlyase subunit 3/multisubunit Na+/H+ antiporter MnhD subunit
MQLVLAAIAGLSAAVVLPLLLWRRDRAALAAGGILGAACCVLGLAGALRALLAGSRESWQGPWGLPIGALRLGLDPLSAFFLCILFGAGLAAALYGSSYLAAWAGERRVAWVSGGFNLLLASAALVFVARDSVVFLFAWEVMSIAAFLLIAFEHQRKEVQSGALWFLVFNHFGVACLWGFFALLWQAAGTTSLPGAPIAFAPPVAAALLLLALLGFGTKAGLAPLHVWLAEAHPVAPSHVSAMLSAVLLKCGVYGLLRTLLIVRGVPPAAGWTLLALGAVSALLGAANLLATSDLKRSLAYSSIENIGIISLSLGLGMVGLASGSPAVAALGLAGALLHCLSHAIFKSLLFTAAGSAVHAAHTRSLDAMGGLGKRMPVTAAVFLAGAAAAAAIPGLAGFASEFFVYRALLEALQRLRPGGQAVAAAALAALALTSALAAAGLARAFGIAFSGTPRSEGAAGAREQPLGMLVPMAVLSAACVLLGLAPRLALRLVLPVLAQLGADVSRLGDAIAQAAQAGAIGLAFLALCAALWIARNRLLARRAPAASVTWGCGYPLPTPSMQYTAPSFSSPLLVPLRGLLEVRRLGGAAADVFPPVVQEELVTADRIEVSGYRRGLAWIGTRFAAVRALHRPRLHQYVVYVFIALIVLLSYAARLVRT